MDADEKDFLELLDHAGHHIEVESIEDETYRYAVEIWCKDCGSLLLRAENPRWE